MCGRPPEDQADLRDRGAYTATKFLLLASTCAAHRLHHHNTLSLVTMVISRPATTKLHTAKPCLATVVNASHDIYVK